MPVPRPRKTELLLEPETEEKLIRLFQKPVFDGQRVARQVDKLAAGHGDAVYASLVFLLAHLEFSGPAARQHWEHILAHQKQLTKKLGRPVELRVALLDHFISRNRKLRSPKILELKIYQLTQREAISDELTGLYNFRYFETALAREVKRAARYEEPFGLLFIDIDDFKNYNDHSGHLAGNQVLRRMARILLQNARQIDVVARYGGEEFAIILPATTKQGALLMAERIRKSIEKVKFPFGARQPKKKVTVSGGLASFPVDAKGGHELIERADTALYRAKSDGKNNIKVFLTETRSFTRVDASMVGSFTVLAQRNVRLSTRNISKSGVLFEADQHVPLGALLDLRIRIPRKKPVRMRTQVVRVERLAKGRFDIGVTIAEMTAADRKRFEAHLDQLLTAA